MVKKIPQGRLEHTNEALETALSKGLKSFSEDNFSQAFPSLFSHNPSLCRQLAFETRTQTIRKIQEKFQKLTEQKNLQLKFKDLDDWYREKKKHQFEISHIGSFAVPLVNEDSPNIQVKQQRIIIKRRKLDELKQRLEIAKKQNEPLLNEVLEKEKEKRELLKNIQSTTELL